MIDPHRESLSNRHAQLDNRIESETRRPAPDALLIATLKREKLKLKDVLSGHTQH